jgi:hypothetical protein
MTQTAMTAKAINTPIMILTIVDIPFPSFSQRAPIVK